MSARWLAAALLLGRLLACPGIETGGPSTTCETFAAKCRLESGPLGICDRGPCPSGQGDCLRCVPQH